jgi:hypothetical protein
MTWRTALGTVLLAGIAWGCGESPAAPSPVYRELWVGCTLVLQGYQCEATVFTEGTGESTQRKVTGLVTWSTSDTSVATINTIGFLTVSRIGDVAVRAKYQDLEGYSSMRVEPGGLSYYHRNLAGWVTDVATGEKLGGVTVQIVDGANTGRAVQTGPDGAYNMYETVPGTFTVRFSKPGYRTLDRLVVFPGDRFVGVDAALTRTP